MSQHDLETIELSMKHAKKAIDSKVALERLTRNRDFKAIVLEGYFESEAVRLVLLKSDPNMQSDESQKEILKQIDAIGSLRQYLRNVMHMGDMAGKAMEDYEQSREEILQEELDA